MATNARTEQGLVRLLDADPQLGEALPPELELEARDRLAAPLQVISKGDWEPPEHEPEGHLGYLILDGLLLREVRVENSRSVELLTVGDLLRPWQEDPTSFSTSSWAALEEARLASLEPSVAARLSCYPRLVSVIAERMMCRARNLAVHWAIANTVGLEKRVMMLFRHLAERWGRVTPEGIAVPQRITHQTVADLIGARRPSATSAISGLAASGVLTRTPDGGWLIRE